MKVLGFVLLLVATTCAPQPVSAGWGRALLQAAQDITVGMLIQGSAQSPPDYDGPSSQTLQQKYTIRDFFSNETRCLAIYLDAPSWMQYNVTVQVTSKNTDTASQQCLDNSIQWRPVVFGVDYIPRELAVAVAYQSITMSSNFTMTGQYSTDPFLLEFDPDGPRYPPTNSTEDKQLFLESGTCVFEAAALKQAGYTAQETRAFLDSCLQGINVTSPPPAAVSPPPPPPPRRGKIRRFVRDVRNDLSLSPFMRMPIHQTTDYPYDYAASTQATAVKRDFQAYLMPVDACPTAFADSDFGAYNYNTTQQDDFASCYFTQTIVYINYAGGCVNPNTLNTFFTVEVDVTADYTPYTECNDKALIKVSRAIYIVAWVTSAPIALFILFLAWPTVWRMLYRGFLLLYLTLLPKSSAPTKRLFRLRMQADMPLRWGWVVCFKRWPIIRDIVLIRKRLLYACLTTRKPNGRRRLLMVCVIAACATSVSVMVWRPTLEIVLDSNPNKITLSLMTTSGPYAGLARYFQVTAIACYMGCLAYLSLLTITNFPDKVDAQRYAMRCRTSTELKPDPEPTRLGAALPAAKSGPSGSKPSSGPSVLAASSVSGLEQRSVGSKGSGVPQLALPPSFDRGRRFSDGSMGSQGSVGSAAPPLLRAPAQGSSAVPTQKVGGPVGRATQKLQARSDQWTAWEIQRCVSYIFTWYLVAWLSLHIGNLAAFLPITYNRLAYFYVSVVQAANIVMILALQTYDMAVVEHEGAKEYLLNPPAPRGFIWALIKAFRFCTCHARRKARRERNAAAALTSGSTSSNKHVLSPSAVAVNVGGGKGAAAAPAYPPAVPGGPKAKTSSDGSPALNAGRVGSVSGGGAVASSAAATPAGPTTGAAAHVKKKKRRLRKNWLLHWWRDDDRHQETTGDRKLDRKLRKELEASEPELSLWAQFKTIVYETWCEETVDIEWRGKTIAAPTFYYPAWFVVSVVAALIMLIFHYLKALAFAEDLGDCIVSWSTCRFVWIRNLALTYSFDQLNLIKSSSIRLSETLGSVNATRPLFDRLLLAAGLDVTLTDLQRILETVTTATTAGNSPRAMWVEEFGQHLRDVSIIGYSLGLAQGLVTLIIAMASFKRIAKANRLLRLSRRIMAVRRAEIEAEAEAAEEAAAQTTIMGLPAGDPTITSTKFGPLGGNLGGKPVKVKERMHMDDLVATTTLLADVMDITQTGYMPMARLRQQRSRRRGGSGSGGPSAMTSPRDRMAVGPLPSQLIPPGVAPVLEEGESRHSKQGSSARLDGVAAAAPGTAPPVFYPPSSESDSSSDDGWGFDKEAKFREPEVASVTSIAALRACNMPIGEVVFFLGVLLSTTVVQLYAVGLLISSALAFLLHSYFRHQIVTKYWPYVAAAILVIVLNRAIVTGLIGNKYLSTGKKIKRPAGWFAFMIIGSITNLVLGLFIAILRLLWLVLTTIFTVGLLDRTILSIGASTDMSHNAFLAGVNLQDGVGKVDVRAFQPGPLWRAVRRWRAAGPLAVEYEDEERRKLRKQAAKAAARAVKLAAKGSGSKNGGNGNNSGRNGSGSGRAKSPPPPPPPPGPGATAVAAAAAGVGLYKASGDPSGKYRVPSQGPQASPGSSTPLAPLHSGPSHAARPDTPPPAIVGPAHVIPATYKPPAAPQRASTPQQQHVEMRSSGGGGGTGGAGGAGGGLPTGWSNPPPPSRLSRGSNSGGGAAPQLPQSSPPSGGLFGLQSRTSAGGSPSPSPYPPIAPVGAGLQSHSPPPYANPMPQVYQPPARGLATPQLPVGLAPVGSQAQAAQGQVVVGQGGLQRFSPSAPIHGLVGVQPAPGGPGAGSGGAAGAGAAPAAAPPAGRRSSGSGAGLPPHGGQLPPGASPWSLRRG